VWRQRRAKSEFKVGSHRYCWKYGSHKAFSISRERYDWTFCSVSLWSSPVICVITISWLSALVEYVRRVSTAWIYCELQYGYLVQSNINFFHDGLCPPVSLPVNYLYWKNETPQNYLQRPTFWSLKQKWIRPPYMDGIIFYFSADTIIAILLYIRSWYQKLSCLLPPMRWCRKLYLHKMEKSDKTMRL